MSIAALLISLVALGLSIINFKAADIAITKRERQFVTAMIPPMTEISRELLGTNAPYTTPPQTIEQLLHPLVTIIEAVGISTSEAN